MASRRGTATRGAAARSANRAITRRVLDLARAAGWPQVRLASELGFSQQMYVRYDAGEAVLDSAMTLKALLIFNQPAASFLAASTAPGVAEDGAAFEAQSSRRAKDAEIALRLSALSDAAHARACARILTLTAE